jgi:hypothetical protein
MPMPGKLDFPHPTIVIPAKAGTHGEVRQCAPSAALSSRIDLPMGSGFRRNDELGMALV